MRTMWLWLVVGGFAFQSVNGRMGRLRKGLLLAATFVALAPATAFANCGASGQPACIAVPPCKIDLTVDLRNGRCYHPDCGRHNQGACSPIVRLQPCDHGFLPDPAQRMRCVKPRETVAAKEITLHAVQQACKAAVQSILSAQRLPAEFQHYVEATLKRSTLGEVQRAIDSPAARKATGEFLARNVPLINELGKSAAVVKKKSAGFRSLFAPDSVCGQRTAAQWIATLKAHGFYPNLEAIKLSTATGGGEIAPVASREHESWWIAIELGIEAQSGALRTIHSMALYIALDGSKVMVLYRPNVGLISAFPATNQALGGIGGIKVYWPSTRDEHLWLGAVGTIELSVGAIIKAIKGAGEAAAGVPPEAIAEPGALNLGIDVVWGDVIHKFPKPDFWPSGLGGSIFLGVENKLPLPVSIALAIDGGVWIWEVPFDWVSWCKSRKDHPYCQLGS